MIIYAATNKLNGKMYIGQTTLDVETRKKRHIYDSKRNNEYKHVHHFARAIRKYGAEIFNWEIIENNIKHINLLNSIEIFYIGYFNTFKRGYNSNLGGEGSSGHQHSELTKAKISKGNKGKKYPKKQK